MSKITVGDLEINYKIQGQGDPLVLIMGLGFSLLDWGTEFPEALAQHYKVVLFDNRDAGQTSQSQQAYTIAQMADDVAGLLDALGESKVHLFGISMGGMIAQQFALSHTDKLNKLILGCTAAGGECSKFGSFGWLLSGNMLDLLFTPEFIQSHRDRLTQFLQTTAPYHSVKDALVRQLYAMNDHNTCDRVNQITAPTLVMTGDRDRVILPQNSDFLAKTIPNARLETIQDAAHAFCFSHPIATATTIINFLKP